jgi:hypothetical protein
VKAGTVFRSLKLILRQQGRLIPELFRYATEGAMLAVFDLHPVIAPASGAGPFAVF